MKSPEFKFALISRLVVSLLVFSTLIVARQIDDPSLSIRRKSATAKKETRKKVETTKNNKGKSRVDPVIKPPPPPPPPPTPLLPRQAVLKAIAERPKDPWPRGVGHVVLAIPGSLDKDKGYHEPGGSFSPGAGSFGISVWLTDNKENVKFTSDNIESGQIRQELVWNDPQNIPGIKTESWAYDTTWTAAGLGHWLLDLKVKADSTAKIYLYIRSVGPAGGEIKSLNWDGNRLPVNNHWGLSFSQPLRAGAVRIGKEGDKDWTTALTTLTQRDFPDGWGFAKIDLSSSSEWKITVSDLMKPAPPPFTFTSAKAAIDFSIPSSEFTVSLNAQVAHLLMGLSGRETRPGDPLNYHINWLRQGAYVITALARAGHLNVAKELAKEFAAKDYFGGYGAEADAPGLSLWALDEVAARVRQPEYDRLLLRDVERKANDILRMMTTKTSLQSPYSGAIVPQYASNQDWKLVAQPAKDGLIQGRSDNQFPVFFVNAVSYRGLLSAAAIAERAGENEKAKLWRTRAAELQQAWAKAFNAQENNDRTYISGLWPTGVAGSVRSVFTQGLDARWQSKRDSSGEFRQLPLQTYFELADAHQWLMLENPARVWQTLNWYWRHQAVPGLYRWWEGRGEENTFNEWEKIRGWVKPPHVTPHYWTAAEMVLLQLDMLGYVDESGREPVLVLGAGMQPDWADKPMYASDLLTNSFGKIGWEWRPEKKKDKLSGTMIVYVPNEEVKNRLSKNKNATLRLCPTLRALSPKIQILLKP